MRYILFLAIFSIFLSAKYIEVGNRVLDDKTNLEWQNDSQVNSTKLNWSESIKFCENLELDGYKDWRVPNIVELVSLIDDTKTQPLISNIFKNSAGDFWTSTTYANDSLQAWIVIFNYGTQYYKDKSEQYYVRCVRGGI